MQCCFWISKDKNLCIDGIGNGRDGNAESAAQSSCLSWEHLRFSCDSDNEDIRDDVTRKSFVTLEILDLSS